MKRLCPQCQSSDGLRKIVWGLPSGELDPEKYVVGGCIIPDNPASHECVTCGWSGNLRKNKVNEDIIQ